MDKREFYSLAKTVKKYEDRRFGGASGRHVNERELGIVRSLLPAGVRILDCPVGTGRLSLFLEEQGFTCHGLDVSPAMLELSSRRGLARLMQGDILTTEIPEAPFEAVVSLRFLFHFAELGPFLRRVRQLLPPGGAYVFDTFRRSPRTWFPFLRGSRRTYAHPDDLVRREAEAAGFTVDASVPCFLVSPLIYRFLPLPVVRGLDGLEGSLPTACSTRVFWRLRRPGPE